MSVLQQAKFFTTVTDLKNLPASTQEIPIVGYSNVGKSSLINAITQQKRLAYTSKTPGCTQHINYFSLSATAFLVDLPGYGYAKVPSRLKGTWGELLGSYLTSRSQIIGLILIMDIRFPLKPLDLQLLEFFATTYKKIHLVLSKADKLTTQQQNNTIKQTANAILQLKLHNISSMQLFSIHQRQGIIELGEIFQDWLHL